LDFTLPFFITRLRATPRLLSMWPCTLKSDEEKSIYVGLSQENGFSPTRLALFAEAGKKRSSKALHLLKKRVINLIWLLFPILLKKRVINMIWLLFPILNWTIIMIGPGGLLLVVPTYLHSSFMGGVVKK
jgi:hypothetical protein